MESSKFVDVDLESVGSARSRLTETDYWMDAEELEYDFCPEAKATVTGSPKLSDVFDNEMYTVNNQTKTQDSKVPGKRHTSAASHSCSSSSSFFISDQKGEEENMEDDWMCVERDLGGNIHMSFLHTFVPPLRTEGDSCLADHDDLVHINHEDDSEYKPNLQVSNKESKLGSESQELNLASLGDSCDKILGNTEDEETPPLRKQDWSDSSSAAVSKSGDHDPSWQVLEDGRSVIPKSELMVGRKLSKSGRAQALAIGASSALAATVLFSSTPFIMTQILANILFLNSMDLVKLSVRGRSKKLSLDQRRTGLDSLLTEISLLNGEASLLNFSAATFARWVLSASMEILPLPFGTLIVFSGMDWLNRFQANGVLFSPMQITEKALSGMMSSLSSHVLKKSREKTSPDTPKQSTNTKSKKQSKKKKRKKLAKKVIMGGLGGIASGVIGPVVASPLAENALMELYGSSFELREVYFLNQE